jgi:hypothetical protein
MNRRTAARVVPALLLVTLVLSGCCNENWKGVGTVGGTLTLNGVWPIGEINAISVQTIDGCDNKYVHWSALEGTELNAVRDSLLTNGTLTVQLEEQEVVAGTTLVRFMTRPTETFRSAYEIKWSSEFKLKKDGSRMVTINYTFPEPDSH